MIRKQSHPLQGAVLSATAFSLYSCGDALVKHMSSAVPLMAIFYYSALVVTILLLMLAPKLGGFRAAFASRNKKWHALRGFIGIFQSFAGMYAFSHLTLAKAYALLFSAPFITVLLAWFVLKEHVTPAKWAAIAAGFCGVLVVLRPGLIPLDLPCLAALASAFLFSLSNLIVRSIKKDGETLLGVALFPNLVQIACVFPFAAAAGFPLLAPEMAAGIIALGVLSLLGFFCLTLAFMKVQAAMAAPFHYIQILWAILFGSLFFGDALDPWIGAGAFIIIASGFMLLRDKKAPPEVAAPFV